MSRSRNWLVTINNPEKSGLEILSAAFKTGKFSYCCGQLEKGEKGTVHLQAFFNGKNAIK